MVSENEEKFFCAERCGEKAVGARCWARMRGKRKRGTMYRAPTGKIPASCGVELFFLGNVDDYLRGDVAEDFDGDGIFAEGFDGIGELDLALVDFEVLRGEAFGDVGSGDGAEHLVVLSGLAGEVQGHAIEES